MPKLLVFAPCHRVLFDQDSNVSLISIFQELRVPASDQMPAEGQAMIRWEVLAVWARLPTDDGRTFEQDVLLMSPDGKLAAHTKQQFAMPEAAGSTHRNVSTMYGFPIGLAGEYSLVLKLKDIHDETNVLTEATYPLHVHHVAKDDPNTES